MNWRRYNYDRDENLNLNLYGILNRERPNLSAAELAQAAQIIRNQSLSNSEKAAQLSSLNPEAFSGYFEDPKLQFFPFRYSAHVLLSHQAF